MIISATAQNVSVAGGELLTGEYGGRAAVKLSPDFDICDSAVVNFKFGDTVYECDIADGYADLPYFESVCPVLIGVYGYTTDGDSLELRLSPKPFSTAVMQGSYCEGEPAPLPTPGTYESLTERIDTIDRPVATEINEQSLNTSIAGAKAVYDAIRAALFVDSEASV